MVPGLRLLHSYGQQRDGQPAGDQFLGIQRSTDAGAIGSFRPVAGPSATTPGTKDSIDPTDDALFYAPFIVIPSGTAGTAGEVWLGTNRLYRSAHRGDDWQKVGPVLLPPIPNKSPTFSQGISAIACAPGHPEHIYVGTSNGRLFRFDQSGGSWGTDAAQAFTELTANLTAADASLIGTFVSDIAVVRNGSDDRLVVALGLNHVSGQAAPRDPSASLALSENNGGLFSVLTVDTLTFPDGTTLDGQHNFANAVAIDPSNPAIVYIGCDFGVFRYQVGVDPRPPRSTRGFLMRRCSISTSGPAMAPIRSRSCGRPRTVGASSKLRSPRPARRRPAPSSTCGTTWPTTAGTP